jgi:hypothetical protein
MHYFKQIVMVDAFLLPFATHHRFISFVLYVIGEFPSVPREVEMIRSTNVLIHSRLEFI